MTGILTTGKTLNTSIKV